MTNTTSASKSIRDFFDQLDAIYENLQRVSSGNPELEKLLREFQKSYDLAKESNLERYDEIIKGYDQTAQNVRDFYSGYGNQRRQDIRTGYNSLKSAGYQDLISRGLRGSTIAPTMAAGYHRQQVADVNRLNDQVNRARTQALTNLDTQKYGFMERRSDLYPDMSAYIQALQAAGRG